MNDGFDYLGFIREDPVKEKPQRNKKSQGAYLLYGAITGGIGVTLLTSVYIIKKYGKING